MAGKNAILKPGQTLFKAGDQSNGMFLVRKGELEVYLENDGSRVSLARVKEGGLIGEMALFDKKPRSAFVSAVSNTEVTHITNDDFVRLMKQIPKWFVSLMTTLSERLRSTNERLQSLEKTVHAVPMQNVIRLIYALALIWHKDGEKKGKKWCVDQGGTMEYLEKMFGESQKVISSVIQVLIGQNLIEQQKGSYNNNELAMASRGVLDQFAEYLANQLKASPRKIELSDSGMEMLTILFKIAERSAYETLTVALDELVAEGQKRKKDTSDWKEQLARFKSLGDNISLVKTSNGGMGIRTEKKALTRVLQYHTVIKELFERNVAV